MNEPCMTDNPSISVVIATYNRRHTLQRALESVLGQNLQPDQIIVVDDGSTDGSADWLLAHYPEIELLQQSNQGVSHARNQGIRHATGDWIALLDSDDEWLANKLACQVEYLQNHPDAVLVHSDEIWIRNGVRVNAMYKHKKRGGNIFQHCLPLCAISPSSVLIKTSVFQHCGLFDESLPACEDYDLWLRICSHFSVAYIDTPLIIKHGGHADQLSRKYWGMDRFRVQALEKIITSGHLRPDDRHAAISMLLRKCHILMQGAEKRNNHSLRDHYQVIMQQYLPETQSQHYTSPEHSTQDKPLCQTV